MKILLALVALLQTATTATGPNAADFPQHKQLAQNVYVWSDVHPSGLYTTNNLIVITSDGVLVADGQKDAEDDEEDDRRDCDAYPPADQSGRHRIRAWRSHRRQCVVPVNRHLHQESAAERQTDDAEHGEHGDSGARQRPRAHRNRSRGVPAEGEDPVRERGLLESHLPQHAGRRSRGVDSDAEEHQEHRCEHDHPGHGVIEDGPAMKASLAEFEKALQHIVAEATRLHKAGVAIDAATSQANWGPYAAWTASDRNGRLPSSVSMTRSMGSSSNTPRIRHWEARLERAPPARWTARRFCSCCWCPASVLDYRVRGSLAPPRLDCMVVDFEPVNLAVTWVFAGGARRFQLSSGCQIPFPHIRKQLDFLVARAPIFSTVWAGWGLHWRIVLASADRSWASPAANPGVVRHRDVSEPGFCRTRSSRWRSSSSSRCFASSASRTLGIGRSARRSSSRSRWERASAVSGHRRRRPQSPTIKLLQQTVISDGVLFMTWVCTRLRPLTIAIAAVSFIFMRSCVHSGTGTRRRHARGRLRAAASSTGSYDSAEKSGLSSQRPCSCSRVSSIRRCCRDGTPPCIPDLRGVGALSCATTANRC